MREKRTDGRSTSGAERVGWQKLKRSQRVKGTGEVRAGGVPGTEANEQRQKQETVIPVC